MRLGLGLGLTNVSGGGSGGAGAPAVTQAVVDTYLTGTEWTAPAAPASQEVTAEVWGGGQGSLQDTTSGEGGDYARAATTVTGSVAYPFTVGTAGAAGGGNGGDGNWNNGDAVAAGGGSATVSSGDQTYSGGPAVVGTGSQAGGGGAGSGGDSVSSIGGPPDGGFTTFGIERAFVPAAGASSQGLAEHPGAQGLFRITFEEEIAGGWAYPVGWGQQRDGANVTSRDMTVLPLGEDDGAEIAIAFFAVDGAPTVGFTGWTEVETQATEGTVTLSAWWRTLNGADPVTITTSAVEAGALIVGRFRATGTPEGTMATGAGTSAQPPEHTASGGSGNYLVIAVAASDTLTKSTPAWPAGYGNRMMSAPISSAGVGLLLATKRITAASETPVAFGTPDDGWVAATFFVPVSE